MQEQRESEQKNRPVVLQVTNVMELGNFMKKLPEGKPMPTLVHFTSEQWNSAMESVIPVKKRDLNQPILEAVRMPGGNGEWIVGLSRCPPGCEPLIRGKLAAPPEKAPDRLELTPDPDTIYIPECDCSKVPIKDGIIDKLKEPGTKPSKDSCRLVIRLHNDPRFQNPIVRFSCENEGKDCKGCKIGRVGSAQRGRVVLLGCVCS